MPHLMGRFVHLRDYRLMVCRDEGCRYAVLPNQLDTHLAGVKHRLLPAERQAVRREVASWEDLFQNENDLEGLRVPRDVPPAFPCLTTYTDGKRCCHVDVAGGRCVYICRDRSTMQKHCRTQHGWVNEWRKGSKTANRRRAGLSMSRPWTDGVSCQRFFIHGPRQEYFEVQPADRPAADETLQTTSSKWDQARRQLTQSWNAVQAAQERTIREGQPDEVNPWLERTGWEPYLAGLDHAPLVRCVTKPDEEEEPVNSIIWQTMGELIQYSQRSVKHRVGVFVRLEAIRTEKHQTRYQPLQPYMATKTLVKYSRPWQQVLMFIARTQAAHDWVSPTYELTADQIRTWQALVHEAEKVVDQQTPSSDEDKDKDSDDREDEDQRRDGNEDGIEESLTDVQRACLRFCVALLRQRITRKEYDSVLVCALAILGVKDDGWRGPDEYPPILSAMVKVSRFLVIQQGLEFEAMEDPASNEFVGCLTWVQRMMDQFMVRGSHGPMQWMLDLRTYGMKIYFNTTAEGHIDWHGDTVLYKKIQFSMADFRGMVHDLVAETRRLLREELTLTSDEELPVIPWRDLRDNPVNRQAGWNFTQDERNRFPVDGVWWLFNRIGQNTRLARRFLRSGPIFAWNRVRVEEYMAAVVRFRENLLVLMHMTGGQPARGTEILSIRHSNTIKGEHRNVFIENGLVVFVTRYHKGYAVSGDVKIIHRYLPRAVGELWVWYAWLILPFQQRLEVDVWQKDEVSSYVWPADPKGRQWTSARMSTAMRRISVAGLGAEIGLQAYRDLAIAISRRYLRPKEAFRRDEDDEDGDRDEDVEAVTADEQTGHTSHTAGMVYARGIMERDGEVASKRERFRGSSVTWHRFLGFPPGPDDEKRTAAAGDQSQKRKRVPFEEEYEEARIERYKRLRRTDVQTALQEIMGPQAQFRGIQESVIKTIMAGESPIVAVMGTGGGKSLLFMLPAYCSRSGVTVVVVPLIALRQDMKRRCEEMGLRCQEWESRRPGDGAQVVLVTPESAVSEGFNTFLTRMRATQQLDRIVIDECHVVLNDKMDFRKQLQQLGQLCGTGVQMVLLTATLPPCKEAELWRRMDFRADEVRLFRARTRRRNIRYELKDVSGYEVEEKQTAVVDMIQRKLSQYDQGKTVVYCNSVDKVKVLAEALGCDAYYSEVEDRKGRLERFIRGEKRVIVATSALGMGIDIPDIRVVWHVDRPRTLLDYAQESGRAGRDGLKSEAIMVKGWGEGDYGEKREEVELVKRLMGGKGCRREVLEEYLDGLSGQACEEGDEKCDGCEKEDGVESDIEKGMKEGVEDGVKDGVEDGVKNGGKTDKETGGETGREKEAEVRRLETETERNEIEWEERRIRMQLDRQRRQGRRGTERMQEEGLELIELEGLLRRAKGRCASCVQEGVSNEEHVLFSCRESHSEKDKEEYERLKEAIRRGRTMEKYSGCMECFLPQAWCNQWEQSDGVGGMYRRKAGVKCDFQDVVLSGFIVGIRRKEGAIERLRERMTGQGYDIERQEEVVKYLGQKRIWGGLETSVLLREYYEVRGI
jgi:superfamily II DNA helicase RecQ